MSSAKSKPKKTRNPAPSNTPTLSDSASVIFRGTICGDCLHRVLTNQNGTVAMHEDGTPYSPYGTCPQATPSTASGHQEGTREPLILDSVFLEAQAFNERHRKVLEDPKNDPTLRENWLYFPAADGNKKRMVYKPFIGLK
jgi:hypothetical protein